MSKHLERDLAALEHLTLAMAALVEEMIAKACRALRNGRADLAREVIEADVEVDRQEVRIEEECLKILALHQPVATDLRRTAAFLKINNDIERIADLAVNVAQRAQTVNLDVDFRMPPTLERMSEMAAKMVRDALDSLVNLSPAAARKVCAFDDRVDAYKAEVSTELCRRMKADPDSVETLIHYHSAARDLERIADHATNIAEDVIYMVEGEIARHPGRTASATASALRNTSADADH